MGGKLSVVIRSLSRKQQTKSEASSGEGIMEFTKPKCEKNNRKKRELMEEPVPVSKWTLKDWISAYPKGASISLRAEECFNGGEPYVFKQSSKSVHLSSASARFHCEASSTEVSSVRRSQSERLKKRVNFRLPEEADIILFHSPLDTRE